MTVHSGKIVLELDCPHCKNLEEVEFTISEDGVEHDGHFCTRCNGYILLDGKASLTFDLEVFDTFIRSKHPAYTVKQP